MTTSTSTSFFARRNTKTPRPRRGRCFVIERPTGVRLLDGTKTRWFEVRRQGWIWSSLVDAFLNEQTANYLANAINAGLSTHPVRP